MFYKFLQVEGAVQDNPAELLATQKMWQRVPKVLTSAAVERFLTAPHRTDVLWQRDRAILELMYATGCRVSEVANMHMANAHLSDGYCLAEGKGSKQRMVPLGRQAVEAIQLYLKELRPKLAHGKDLAEVRGSSFHGRANACDEKRFGSWSNDMLYEPTSIPISLLTRFVTVSQRTC